MLGVAVTSSSPAVAARCAHARAGVGAVASQNVTDPRLGPKLLDLLAEERTAAEAIDLVVATEPAIEFRQLTAVDRSGQTGSFSGSGTLGTYAVLQGEDAVAAGNLLAGSEVVDAMVQAFADSAGRHLGSRLVRALQAGLEAGGEAGPVRSAGMLVAHEVAWPVADLRVDWHDEPITELARLWDLWEPQLDAYVTRALDPSAAPSFGVPGDPV
jgi:uncharacterized Ntn-hydrolase superfamily protein